MANPEDLGRYRLKRLLGRGVLGEVWAANDLEHEGHKVAVKILHAADDELALARLQFAREARLSVHIRHPNLAQVLDAGEAAGTSFMVMEMVEGTPLRQLIGDESVTYDEKLRWLRQIGDAMVLMHRTDLIHRDLKPENVIIRPDRSACLVDLGIAKWTKFELGGERDPFESFEDSEAHENKKRPNMTYAPPETDETEIYDELGDQWAWGTLAYELITGKMPTPESPPLKERDDVPANVAEAIDKARAPKREARWDALEIALDEIGPGSRPPIRHEVVSASRAETLPPASSVVPASAGPMSMGPPRALSPLVLGIGILIVLGIIVAAVASLR